MSALLIVAALVAAACYLGCSALAALRSGEITLYVRASRDRHFSRRANPAAWLVVACHLVLATACAAGIVIRVLWQ
jgi:hypothetical protein